MPLSFDGSDDYLSTTSIGSGALTGITASAWVYDTGNSGDGIRVACARMIADHDDYSQWLIGRNGSNWIVRCLDDDTSSHECSSAASFNTWVHLCMTVANNGTMYLYVNGVQTDTDDFSGETIHSTNEPETVGARDKNDTIQSFYLGRIHDVRVYNRQMNAVEVLNLYTSRGRDKDYYGLLLRWQLSDNTTGTATSVKETGPSQLTVTVSSSPAWIYSGVLRIA